VNRKQAPVFGTVVTGIFAGGIALIFDLDILANMISIGTLMAFTVVCAGVIVLRLRDERGDTKEHEYQSHAYVPFMEPVAKAYGDHPVYLPLTLIVYAVFCVFLSIALDYTDGYIYLTIIAVVPLALIWLLLLSFRPRNVPSTFKCPLVPAVPLLGVFCNIFLICNLDVDSIYRVMVWSVIGILIYGFYGIRNSRLNSDVIAEPLKIKTYP